MISANETGVDLSLAGSGNLVQYNYIGLNAQGTAALTPLGETLTQQVGVWIDNSPGTMIGADTFKAGGNVISGNQLDGVYVDGATSAGTQIKGNYIGADNVDGSAIPNGQAGVHLGANEPGGLGRSPSTNITVTGNDINDNLQEGIALTDGTNSDTVASNFIFQNQGFGILLQDSPSNTIGKANAGNTISSTALSASAGPSVGSGIGIRITGGKSSFNKIQSNTISDNAGKGILVDAGAFFNTIGGAGLGNIIVGNTTSGIDLSGQGTLQNSILGNMIGVNAAGLPEGNHAGGDSAYGDGIDEDNGAYGNVIGGSARGAGNVISANTGYGIVLNQAGETFVEGNLIGTNPSGALQAGYGNAFAGVDVFGGKNSRIGGETSIPGTGAGNKIIGDGVGVILAGSTSGVFVQGNEIAQSQGFDTQGADTPDGIGKANGVGILLVANASNNLIGGYDNVDANAIYGNPAEGVDVYSGTGNSILRNQIFDNIGPGIFNQNPGPNREFLGQLSLATTDGTNRLAGWLDDAQPNATYTIEIFAGNIDDAKAGSENDNAETLLTTSQDGSAGEDQMVTTNASGVALFQFGLPDDIADTQVLIATDTDASGSTSEFSNPVLV
ncbi:MAG: right-handed parallel beta-helix repeat-containing protein, partial [Pirellulales bacterium]